MTGIERTTPGRRPYAPSPEDIETVRLEAMRRWYGRMEEALRPAVAQAARDLSDLGEVLHQVVSEANADLVDAGVPPEPVPLDPCERALFLRRHRNTGPPCLRLDGRRQR